MLTGLLALAALAGCGGGDSAPGNAPAPSASTVIDASGGSLVGPDGVRLDVPAGALTGPVTITMTREATGAPALLDGQASTVYAITPHGLPFKKPAVLTFPAAVLPGQSPLQTDVLRAQPGGQWQVLAPPIDSLDGSASVLLDGLSYYSMAQASSGPGPRTGVINVNVNWTAPEPGVPVPHQAYIYRRIVGQAIGSTTLDNLLPRQVSGLAHVAGIATRYNHTLAVTDSGQVWGFGPEESLALGPVLGHRAARQVAGLAQMRQVAAGERHSLALAADGTVWSWGENGAGQLGTGSTGAGRATPQPIPGLADVVQIAAGHRGGWALLASGVAYGWGDNRFGQVGVGSASALVSAPAQLPAGWVAMAGGEFHGLAMTLTVQGRRVCGFGNNGNLQLDGLAGPDANAPRS